MADNKKPTWASKFTKKEGLDPQKGTKIFVESDWKASQVEGLKNVEIRAKENEKNYKKASKLKQVVSQMPKSSTTDKTVTPPTKTI